MTSYPEALLKREDPSRPWSLEDSYRYCEFLTYRHYENFPVASIFIPRRMRRHVAAVYAFARTADDFADENQDAGTALSLLEGWEKNLRLCYEGQARFPIFVALQDTARRFSLPMQLFLDLLDAFKQDVRVQRYPTFADVLNYCRRSANPVGRLVLLLFGYKQEELFGYSDAICTALQLTNFWQDLAVDWQKARVYIPEEDLRRFGYSTEELGRGAVSGAFRELMEYQIQRTEGLFGKGEPLLGQVKGRLRMELTLVWLGGMRILAKIRRVGFDVFAKRPTLNWKDKIWMLMSMVRLSLRGGVSRRSNLDWIASSQAPRNDGEGLAERYCSNLTRLSRSNFYVAFLFLPRPKRRAIHAVYAFCRVLDDSVDRALDEQAKAKGLERWKRYLEDAYRGRAAHPVMIALIHAIQEFEIPKEYFLELIAGVQMDLEKNRYGTFQELRGYCYRVASVVGLICIRIFGFKGSDIPKFAENLGIAFQMTNILRDVRKDAALGRIYLPLEDLQRFGVPQQDILDGRITDGFRRMMESECARAEGFYKEAEKFWSDADLPTLFPAVIMKNVYLRLLQKIRAHGFDVYCHDFTLPAWKKLWIAFRIYLKAKFFCQTRVAPSPLEGEGRDGG